MSKLKKIGINGVIEKLKEGKAWNNAATLLGKVNVNTLKEYVNINGLELYTKHFDPKYKSIKTIKCNCVICGKEMEYKPTKKIQIKRFCSQTCGNKQEGRKHGPNKKVRLANLTAIRRLPTENHKKRHKTELGPIKFYINELNEKVDIEGKSFKHKKLILKKDKICAWDGTTPINKYVKCCKKNTKYMSMLPNFIKLGFDTSKVGTPGVWNEIVRIKDKIQSEYDSGKSLKDLNETYKFPDEGTLGQFLEKIGFKRREISDAIGIAFIQGKFDNMSPHTGIHLDWEGNSHVYRSSLEKSYYKVLDEQKIKYETESLNISYLCTQTNKKKYNFKPNTISNL